jgi:hypothetical protein
MTNHKGRLFWGKLFIFIALFGLLSTQAIAASFDCNKAASWLEKTVCSDPELSKLDEQLGKAYQDALASLSPEGQEETKQYQRQWLKQLPGCQSDGCLEDSYKERIEQLQHSLIKFPDWTFRNVHVSHSKAAKKCPNLFIKQEVTYPQIENPRDENEKIWNNLISKKASDDLENPTCGPTGCESDCVDIDATITISFNSKYLISCRDEQWWHGHGAAHGYTNGAIFNWLLEAKRELQASDLFDDKTDWRIKLAALVSQKLKEQGVADKKSYEINPTYLMNDVTFPGQWVISSDGLGIQFGEYELGYRTSPLIKIDWKTLDPYLSKNGRSLIYD